MSVGLILGPMLGGVIYQTHGYFAAFGLAFGFIGVDLALRIILVEKKIAIRYTVTPLPNAEGSPSIKMHDLPPLNEPKVDESSTPPSTVAPAHNVWTSRIPTGIRILKYPRLLTALFLSFVQALILSAFDATLPLYLNRLFGYSSFQSGI